MKKRRRWPRLALLVATLTGISALSLLGLDLMGIGPNPVPHPTSRTELASITIGK